MKKILAFACVLNAFLGEAQNTMFWNHYANYNPAMSGFQYEQHGALTSRENWKWNKGLETVQANYGQRIYGQHGIGINYTGNYFFWANNALTVNYNYQFDLNNAGKLSAGTGIGASRTHLRERYSYFEDSTHVYKPTTDFLLNFGVAYSWKNLLVGVTTSDLTIANVPIIDPPMYRAILWNAFASYDFQITPNFQLTPRLNFRTLNGGLNPITSNLTATFYEKYAVGISFYPNNQLGVNLGWDIQNKFRVAYMISTYFYKNNQVNFFDLPRTHEFSVGYILKNDSKSTIKSKIKVL